jgi:hypothetical protein
MVAEITATDETVRGGSGFWCGQMPSEHYLEECILSIAWGRGLRWRVREAIRKWGPLDGGYYGFDNTAM